MKKIGTLLLVVLIPLVAYAADPAVTQNAPQKNINNTLNISCTITPGAGQTLGNIYGVVRPKGSNIWVRDAFLGNGTPPFTGNTDHTYAKDQVLEIGILVN